MSALVTKLKFAYFCLVLSELLVSVHLLEICLFASCGCHSHDVMMKSVGDNFQEANITWVQSHVFEFGFGLFKLPEQWNQVRVFEYDANVVNFMKKSGALIWQMNVPMDFHRPWDFRAVSTFNNILKRNREYCRRMVQSKEFRRLREQRKFDLVVVDHIVQACTTVMASLLNATTVQYSNWPICDGYLTSFNVPANPSYVPKTLSPFSGNSMNFIERLYNTLFHGFLVLLRTVEAYLTSLLYYNMGITGVNIFDIEAKQILYGARSGLIFEAIRPLTNRIKYFGCPSCGNLNEYEIASPKLQPELQCLHNKHFETLHRARNISEKRLLPHFLKECQPTLQHQDNTKTKRFLEVQRQHPDINFYKLEIEKFALISFGSLAKVENMPAPLLELCLETLGRLPYMVIWQTNSDMTDALQNYTVPSNVILSSWVPLKILLAHRNLMYFISHGGINTVNELLYFGVPIIGVPLQGDQLSNIQRLVDLGMGKLENVGSLWTGGLAASIKHMEENLEKYSKRAKKIAGMARDQRTQFQDTQQFWLQWAARHGAALRKPGRKYFDLFYRSSYDYFAIPQFLTAGFLIILVFFSVC